MRVCILTPGPLGSDPRVVKEADALTEANHQVTVISTRMLTSVDRLDEAILANASWRALRLDFRVRGVGWRLRRAFQVAQQGVFSLSGSPVLAVGALSPITGALRYAAKTVVADLYIAHYPAALSAAAYAARLNDAHYAYDAEDFHLGDWPEDRKFGPIRRIVRAVESRYLPDCAYITAASPGIAAAYAETYGLVRPTVLLNVFPRAQAPGASGPAGTVVQGPSIYWFSQTVAPGRGLETAVEAIGKARTRPHLYVRGSPMPGFIETLRSIAMNVNVTDRLHVLPSASPLDMVRLATGYDLGLSSEAGETHNHMITLGNKVFTYILAGIPVLLSDMPAHCSLALEAGDAVRIYSTGNATSLASVMDELLGDPHVLANARSAAFRLGQLRFNWDVEKAALLDLVAAVPARADANSHCSQPHQGS
jgi:glycosyltransferase involved in cell wall biosynthesis